MRALNYLFGQPSIYAGGFICFGMLLFVVVGLLPWQFLMVPKAVFAVVMCVIFYGASVFLVRQQGLKLSSYNLSIDRLTLMRMLLGFALGSLITGVMLLAVFTFTSVTPTPVDEASVRGLVWSSLVIVPLALMEELLFRGYGFFQLVRGVSARKAIYFTAILFGLYHLNDGNSVANVLLGPGVWGVVFGVAAYLTNSISVPLGLHIAANFIQGVFGLKDHVNGYFVVETDPLVQSVIEVEHLGMLMQLVLLICSVVILELAIRCER